MVNDVQLRIRTLLMIITVAFLVLFGYQAYWQVIKADWLTNKPTNRRLARAEKLTPRGAIYDSNGVKLAWTENGERKYADPIGTAAVIGYMDPVYGRVGVEGEWNLELAGLSRTFDAAEVERVRRNEKPQGKDVALTLDLKLQQIGRAALGDKTGALVMLDPTTGAILALVTSPTYDPTRLQEYFTNKDLAQNGELRNRATQDVYPPGSTMKVLTATAALTHGVSTGKEYTCTGKTVIGGAPLKDYGNEVHGTLSMESALAKSCNNYFAHTAADLGAAKFYATATSFGFGSDWWNKLPEPRMLPVSMTKSNLTAKMEPTKVNKGELAHMGFGQSTVVVTPLQMAMIAATVANDGTTMAPYLVTQVRKADGTVLNDYKSQQVGFPMNKDIATTVSKMMRKVVTSGTGTRANMSDATVYGKTGTAEQDGGDDHAWFIGFATQKKGDETRKVAFAVILERGGTGGVAAVPVARKVLEAWVE